jgi:hypothetical protein
MSGISVTLDGLSALLRDMEQLPDGLEASAAPIITRAAERARGDIVAAIPTGGSGTLAGRVTVAQRDTLRAQVESRAPHAWLYEYGSGRRVNRAGANRGVMPASKLVGRVASNERRRMNSALVRIFDEALRKVGQL